MPRTNTDDLVTTTLQLRRESFERLERALVGRRNRDGLRISKRAVFQFMLDEAMKDRGSQLRLFAALHDRSD